MSPVVISVSGSTPARADVNSLMPQNRSSHQTAPAPTSALRGRCPDRCPDQVFRYRDFSSTASSTYSWHPKLLHLMAMATVVLLVVGIVGTRSRPAEDRSRRQLWDARSNTNGSAALPIFGVLASELKQATAAAGGPPDPQLIVGLTHHKTGTSQLGCIGGTVLPHLGLLPHTYVNNRASVSDLGRAVVKGALRTWQPQWSPPAEAPRRAPAVLFTGNALQQQCQARDNRSVACANNKRCPCTTTSRALCMDTDPDGTCFLEVPAVPTRLVHVIRRPIDTVISAYYYHTQDPPPEDWLTMEWQQYMPWMVSVGVPEHELRKIAGMDVDYHGTYHALLRSLPVEQGIALEFWRSLFNLYAMARQHRLLAGHPGLILVRYEELQHNFNEAASRILVGSGLVPPEGSALADAVAVAAAACDLSSMAADSLVGNQHVTRHRRGKAEELKLENALLEDPLRRWHLCRLHTILGYDQAEACQRPDALTLSAVS